MALDAKAIEAAIGEALKTDDLEPTVVHDIAFHMTDWLDDLEAWTAFCSDPSSLKPDEVKKLLIGFLIHVPNHVAAAHKLLLGYPMMDIFEVGAFE